MATQPFAPALPAVARILSHYDRAKVEAFVEVAIGLLDTFDARDDPDEADFNSRSDGLPGDPADHEPTGDEESGAYVEWHTMRGSQKRGPNIASEHGDDEDDDPAEDSDEDRCHAGDDGCGAFLIHGHVQWGAQEEEGGVSHPKYGEDQSKGPIGPWCG